MTDTTDRRSTHRRWWRAGAHATTRVCPRCQVAGLAQLAPGELCATCRTQRAWAEVGAGDRLIIDHASIAAAVRRRQGETARRPWASRLDTAEALGGLGAIGLACGLLLGVRSPRPIAPLEVLLDELRGASGLAMIAGLATLGLGLLGMIRRRRRSHGRRLRLLALTALTITAGASAFLIGGVQWLQLRGGFAGQYTSMPARPRLSVSANVERILDATVVILAPGADGDARRTALGTGAVIARDPGRAWIVTCSHVAMPEAAVGSFRHAREAPAVWVQLADGRDGRARVRWTAPPPLDVALVELPVDHAPTPVPIARDAAALQPSAAVLFVPNPYRAGWMVHHGRLLRREPHTTPAGRYELLFTDLPVTHGDSGSGLYDARGALVGLNTWTRVGDGAAEGISLPAEALQILADAITNQRLDELDSIERPTATPQRR